MNIAPIVESSAARFDRLSLRERLLILAAVLAVLFVLWDALLLAPLESRRRVLSTEIDSLQSGIAATAAVLQSSMNNDPTRNAIVQIARTQRDIAALDRNLQSASVGLLPPDRMTAVLQDLLRQRQQVKLVSLRTETATRLLPGPQDQAGPYLHPVELVLRGSYLDILNYLQALEALHWRLYWKTLELDSSAYPVDRVRIEIGTISLDRAWLGI
jgi:MSHA biogenesis protein MshJ